MFTQRWLRLLPGRSQLMLLGGVAFAVFMIISFADLAVSKSAMMASHQQAQALVARLRAQRGALQRELDRAQSDQQVMSKAFAYFGQGRSGVNVVVGQSDAVPAAAPADAADTQGTPHWGDWLQRLRQP